MGMHVHDFGFMGMHGHGATAWVGVATKTRLHGQLPLALGTGFRHAQVCEVTSSGIHGHIF